MLRLNDAEARGIIERFEAAAKAIRGDEEVSDNVAQHMLQAEGSLQEEAWLGTPDEERDA